MHVRTMAARDEAEKVGSRSWSWIGKPEVSGMAVVGAGTVQLKLTLGPEEDVTQGPLMNKSSAEKVAAHV
jgi:hypothetical protein